MPRGFNRAYLYRLKQNVPPSFLIGQYCYFVESEPRDPFIRHWKEDPHLEYLLKFRPVALKPGDHKGDLPGLRWIGLSPFSGEKTPSFRVMDDRLIYKCFSTQHAGDVFDFLMRFNRMSFPQAVAFVRELDGGRHSFERKPRKVRRPKISRNKKRIIKKGGP
jgi:hypothetical protein